jgi:hypothetical protein
LHFGLHIANLQGPVFRDGFMQGWSWWYAANGVLPVVYSQALAAHHQLQPWPYATISCGQG